MTAGIRLKDSKIIVIEGCTFEGFDTGISVDNSDVLISKTNLTNNKVGLALKDSQSIIHKSFFSGNEIDILAENSSYDVIDSLVSNVVNKEINSMPEGTYGLDKIKIQIKKLLSTKKPDVKKIQWKSLLHNLNEYGKNVSQYLAILKMIMDIIFPK